METEFNKEIDLFLRRQNEIKVKMRNSEIQPKNLEKNSPIDWTKYKRDNRV